MISLWRLPPSGGKPIDLAERLRRRVIQNSDANSDRLAAKDARRRFFLSRMKRVARDGTRVASLMLLNRSGCAVGCAVMKSLDGLPYCIVGGQATRYYMPERSTIDTDYTSRLNPLTWPFFALKPTALLQMGALCYFQTPDLVLLEVSDFSESRSWSI
jgi:hypothetical protein